MCAQSVTYSCSGKYCTFSVHHELSSVYGGGEREADPHHLAQLFQAVVVLVVLDVHVRVTLQPRDPPHVLLVACLQFAENKMEHYMNYDPFMHIN